jgi:alanine-glyoxylate transaminase/serine-glyoxylate transaminase/serine-pyruvate transaminase
VCFRYGQFSHLWVDQAQRLGLDVTVLDEEWGRGANEARLRSVLEADKGKKIKAVMVVHNETTTGVTSDIAKCRAAMDAAGHSALLLVDGVSSIGACEFRFDEWRVDVAMTGSQKALSLPTGLALCCVSPKALEATKTAKLPRVFFSFADMAKFNATGGFPVRSSAPSAHARSLAHPRSTSCPQYTPSVPLLYGLREALTMLREEGMDNAVARHARFAAGTRAAVKAWGLELLCADPRWNSNSLTVIKAPPGMDTTRLVRTAFAKYNLSIGLGLSSVAGKVFRIGHLGDLNEVSLLGALAGTEMALRDCGYTGFAPGAGVGAALEYFQKTSAIIPTREIAP